jgi:hypothetical protein
LLKGILVSKNKLCGDLDFDSKANVENYIRSLGIPYTALVLTAFTPFVIDSIRPAESGYKISLPILSSITIPLIAVPVGAGACVKAILLNRENLLGQMVRAGERECTLSEIIDILGKVGGLDVVLSNAVEMISKRVWLVWESPNCTKRIFAEYEIFRRIRIF